MKGRRPNGDGGIYQRDNGTWAGQVDFGTDPTTGKRLRTSVKGATRTEVAEKLKKLRDEARKPGTGQATVADAVAAHLAHLDFRVATGGLSRSSRQQYAVALRATDPIAHVKLAQLRPTTIETWIAHVPGAGPTRSRAYSQFKAALVTARRDGLTSVDPFRDLRGPSGERDKEPPVATKDDVDVLLSAAEEPWRGMFTVLAFTGLRRSELLAIRWADVDLREQVLRVPQGKTARARRGIPMTPQVVAVFAGLPRGFPAAPVWRGERGGLVSRETLRARFKEAAPGGLTPHSLRHGMATRLLDSGVSPHVVSAILGHSSTKVTLSQYAHSTTAMERAALAAL